MGREPIAIVGIGCRYPGADGPSELWELLSAGRCTVGEIPDDRLGDLERLYSERPGTPGRIMSRRGGFLEAIDRFDAPFFGIAPVEVAKLDPQQRLLLEVSWEALEDAGIPPSTTRGSEVGVYVGSWLHDYETRLIGDPIDGGSLEHLDFYTTTGSGRYSLPGRLSFFYDWHGPSLAVDTACSSSLVALHLACRALWDGDAELALAGGVNVMLSPYINVAYSQSRMLTPDGLCKFGDASANGYVRSEGCGLLVLKPLAAALADGDRVYATVRGSSVNNDGQASGYMATPGVDGQRDMLRKAWRDGGLEPSAAHYIEAHGTGTPAGDPVELGAIGAETGGCLVGSIKTNLGHTEGAAGVAGAIKIALSMHHGTIPASLHHREPNPKIDWLDGKLAVPTAPTGWPVGADARLAGVSGFGIAGTNAHVVLGGVARVESASADAARYALPLSAASPEALETLTSKVVARLTDDCDLPALVAGATHRRDALEYRRVVHGGSATELRDALTKDRAIDGRAEAVGGTVFVCSGVGAHWTGMARGLLASEPAFREALERCDAALAPVWGESALEAIARGEQLRTTDRIQPVVYAIQVALAALWRSRGVEPAVVIGHSMGEIAAAAIAGCLSLDDAAKVIVGRSKFIAETAGQGAMIATGLTLDEARREVDRYEGRLSAAVNNGPQSTVISGGPEALTELAEVLASRGVFCREVKADFAAHSPQMDAPRDKLVPTLAGLAPRAGELRFVSTLDAAELSGDRLLPHYWGRNVRDTVRFAETIELLATEGHATFVELAPHAILSPSIEQTLEHAGVEALVVPSMRRDADDRQSFADALAELWVHGRAELPRETAAHWATLPSYPWQRRRYWYTDAPDQQRRRRAMRRDGAKAWIGPPIGLSVGEGGTLWELDLDLEAQPWLGAHRVGGGAVVSTASLLATLLAVGESFEEVEIARWLWLAEGRRVPAQMTLDGSGAARIAFRPDADAPEWKSLLTARAAGPGEHGDPADVRSEAIPAERLYAELRTEHEQRSHWLHAVRRDGDACVAEAAPIDGTLQQELPIEPGWIAALTQLGEWIAQSDAPVACRWIERVERRAGTPARLIAERREEAIDLRLVDADDRPVLALLGTRWQPLEAGVAESGAWLHAVGQVAVESGAPTGGKRLVLLGDTSVTLDDATVIDGDDLAAHAPYDELVDLSHDIELDEDPVRDAAARAEKLTRLLRAHHETDGAGRYTLVSLDDASRALDAVVAAADQEWPGEGYRRLRVDPGAIERLPEALAAPRDERRLVLDAQGLRAERLGALPALGALAVAEPALGLRDTVLVTGGFGGIGRAVARWAVEQGASGVVLVGRKGAAASGGQAFVEELRALGVQVRGFAVDGNDAKGVAKMLASVDDDKRLAPLRSIFHAAGIADGDFLAELDAARFAATMSGKIGGAQNLHLATRERTLDHFVLFSSIMATIDVPANANYGAANAWLDGLAERRRSEGLPATSIAWGPWQEVGMASDKDGWIGRLEAGGMRPVPTDAALACLGRLLAAGVTRAAVTQLDPAAWRESFVAAAGDPFLPGEAVVQREGTEIRERLQGLEATERREFLRDWVREQTANVLRFDAEQVEPKSALRSLGFDSLMTLQLRNRLEQGLELQLPATLVFNYPSVDKIAEYLEQRLGEAVEPVEPESTPVVESGTLDEEAVADLSDDEVERMLAERIGDLDGGA